jgi:hypothetical protein
MNMKVKMARRVSTVKRSLLDAGGLGLDIPQLLALTNVIEPTLKRDTLAVWLAHHQRQIHAERSTYRTALGYIWYHRGRRKAIVITPSAASRQEVRGVPTQRRVITVTLPSWPRITPLRVYAVAVTGIAATLIALIALEVL